MYEYFEKPKSLGGNVKIQLNLSSYGTKADFENAAGVEISDFTKKVIQLI